MTALRKTAENFENYDSYKAYILKERVDKEAKKLNQQKLDRKLRKNFSGFLCVILLAGIICGPSLFILSKYAKLHEQQYKNNDIQKEIVSLKLEIEEVESSLNSNISLANVERVAKEELNMQYPKTDQYIHVQSNWQYTLNDDTTEIEAVEVLGDIRQ